METKKVELLHPRWPAPIGVRAVMTTRWGGVSEGPYEALNVGDHVGDEPARVEENRRRLREALGLGEEPRWLRQVHGVEVVEAEAVAGAGAVEADACVARRPGAVAVVMTADCLPVLFCDRAGQVVAAAHAGWRGLAEGVLEATVEAMGGAPAEVMAWLGPAIGPRAFEVGEEVREAFVGADGGAEGCFVPSPDKRAAPSGGRRWLADLYGLARRRLGAAGVEAVYGGRWCTWTEEERFFSYRRDGVTGRMAALIWLER